MNQRRTMVMNSTNPLKRIAYNFKQIDDSETEIEIYDVIAEKKSYDWWTGVEGTEVTPSSFKKELNAVQTPNVTIRMNSGGGEVFSANVIAVAIEEAVKAGKHIACKIDGVCASAAVQIATACSEVIIHKSALMMIHNPMSGLCGYYDSSELSKAINMLTATKDSIINAYVEKTGLSKQKLSNMMDAETWMDGNEAVEKGFADKLMFDNVDDSVVFNRISEVCVNQAFNLPAEYRTAINKVQSKQEKGVPNDMEIKTLQDMKSAFPTLCDEFRNEVKNEIGEEMRNQGIESERQRMQAIDAMQGKVQPELLNKAKYETFDTAEKVAMDAITQNAFIQSGVIDAMKKETAPANNVAGQANTGEVKPPVDEKKKERDTASNIAEKYLQSLGKEKK